MSDAGLSSVLFEKTGPHVALVTINRPEARNAINGEVAEALEAIVARTEADETVRAVVLTGAGGKARFQQFAKRSSSTTSPIASLPRSHFARARIYSDLTHEVCRLFPMRRRKRRRRYARCPRGLFIPPQRTWAERQTVLTSYASSPAAIQSLSWLALRRS